MEWVFTKYKTASAETIEVWQELNRNFAAGHPALDNMFLSTLAKYFGSGDELLGLCSDHSGYVAAVIVNPEGRGVWSCFAPGQDCLCSFLISPSGDLESIMSTLLNTLPGNCWLLKMPKLDPMFHSVENLGKLDCAETGYYGTIKGQQSKIRAGYGRKWLPYIGSAPMSWPASALSFGL